MGGLGRCYGHRRNDGRRRQFYSNPLHLTSRALALFLVE